MSQTATAGSLPPSTIYDDPGTIHCYKVSAPEGPRLVLSIPMAEVGALTQVLVRGVASLEGKSKEIVGLVDKLQYGTDLRTVSYQPRGDAS